MQSVESFDNFAVERDLVDHFVPTATELLSGFPATSVLREMELGRRIADVVACGYSESSCFESLAGLRRSSVADLSFLAHLLERPLTARTLSRRTRIDLPDVVRRLDRHVNWGIAHRSPSGAYSAAGWVRWLPKEVVAFEAKLSDWRTAVKQATYYSGLTDRAWVVMPRSVTRNSDLRHECRISGVGLVGVSETGTELVVLPRNRKGSSANRRLLRLRILWASSNRVS